MIESDSPRFSRSDNVVTREYYGDVLLVPIKNDLADLQGLLYHLPSEVAVRIWNLLETERTLDELVRAVASEFDAPGETVESDIRRFLEELESIGALRKSAEAGA